MSVTLLLRNTHVEVIKTIKKNYKLKHRYVLITYVFTIYTYIVTNQHFRSLPGNIVTKTMRLIKTN